ncbi:hypothetical protein K458DRAFT_346974 [Lentithecium fluviatile CBS 122367]|uniref:Uncharacterized protein n=1 Tax=Lentithecium fluviatile CBS 122367 TaxID=1168545 RepID=A0A6G1IMY4_9PLEO|nr:hypothetical protein K458DRAFT_346974 [Lentithecium fluviatile CBS 122367]
METSAPAQEGKLHLAQMLANHPVLAPLCREVMGRMEQSRFINTTRKLLKPYYRSLLREASNERERGIIYLLRSRRGRYRIGAAIARFLNMGSEEDEAREEREDLFELRQRRSEYLNTWLGRIPHVEASTSDFDSSWDHCNEILPEEDEGSSSTDSESETRVLPHLSEMEKVFRDSRSFRLLINSFRKILLPRQLRQILDSNATSQIWLSEGQNNSVINRLKSYIEDSTQLEWNWWPLEARMRALKDDESRLLWRCICGSRLWMEISNKEAEFLHKTLREPHSDSSPRHRCCPRKYQYLGVSRLRGLIHSALPTSSAGQRYTPTPSLVPSTSVTQSSSSSHNRLRPSNTSQSLSQQQGRSNLAQQSTANAIPSTLSNSLWVLFGVQGPRKPLELDHIVIDSATTDDTFYRTLRKQHRNHRGKLRLWLSFWRFQYCDVVKFKRLAPKWVIRDRKDLPCDPEYIYQPRPPIATNPPISRHEFEMHLNACDTPCRWSWLFFHECMPPLDTSTSIGSIPKRNKQFDITNPTTSNKPSEGLEAKHTVSALYVFLYHILILAGPFGFWAWWTTEHPGDLQNAVVPVMVAIGLLSCFWSTSGLLPQGREANGS